MIIIVSVNCKLIKASYLTRAATFGDRFPLVSGGRYFGVFVNDDVVKMPGPDTRTEKHFPSIWTSVTVTLMFFHLHNLKKYHE